MLRNVIFFLKRVSVIKMFWWMKAGRIAALTTPLNSFSRKAEFFRLFIWKAKKNFFIQTKLLHKRISYGHAECSFQSPAKSLLRKSQKLFNQCPGLVKNAEFFQKKCFSWKDSYGHVWCSFDSPAISFTTKNRNVFVQRP